MLPLIRQLLRPYKRTFVIVVAAVLLQAGAFLAAPWPLKLIIDNVVSNRPVPHWANWFVAVMGRDKNEVATVAAGLVVVIAVVGAIANYAANYFIERIGQHVTYDLQLRIYEHLHRLSLSWFRTRQVGSTLSTITMDTANVGSFASRSTVSIFADTMTMAGMLIVMLVLHWDFALIAVGLLPCLMLGVLRVRRAVETITHDVRAAEAEILATVQEGLQSVEMLQALGRHRLKEQQLAHVGRRNIQASLRACRVRSLLSPAATIPIAVCTAFVLWRGSSLILAGTMTLGSLTIVSAYLARFFGPVQDLCAQANAVAQASVAVHRIQELLDADNTIPERVDAIDPPPFRGEIAYERVTFGYERDNPVLRDISFTIRAGELVGIVGATGSGKSAMTSLIPRLHDVTGGTIKIDGTDVRDFKLRGLRDQIAFVLQDTVLLRGTVRDNIAIGRPDATYAEVVQAATSANADEFITRMSNGYHSLIGERGLTLSVGQRQRIGIARALIRNDPILILDEPSAALDAQCEELVLQALERLMEGRTVICVAHRFNMIRRATKIIVLEDGVVAEQGTHDELLACDGAYAQLHRVQYGSRALRPRGRDVVTSD